MDDVAEVTEQSPVGFDVAATLGLVPNDPVTRTYVGGLHVGHGLGRHLGVAGSGTWSPDFGARDLHGLFKGYVAISPWTGPSYSQTFDKLGWTTTLALTATADGSFSWFGSRPLPLSVTALAGFGALSKHEDVVCAPEGLSDPVCPGDPYQIVVVIRGDSALRAAAVLGGRVDVHVFEPLALRLDVRDLAYVDHAIDRTDGRRLYHDVLATMGLAWFPTRARAPSAR